MPAQTARLELRIAPDKKQLIERAAELSNTSVTAFATEVLVERARELVEGPSRPAPDRTRPIGGWSFTIPEDWDEPLEDLADYR